MIDQRLVNEINSIGNDDVEHFYQNPYLNFDYEEMKGLQETIDEIL